MADANERSETSTVHALRFDPTKPSTTAFTLTVIEGADVGRRLVVDPAAATRVFVGKSDTCELQVDDPLVSRRHLALEVDRDRLHVVDLGSTNGTTLDGVALVEGYARGGESLRIGSTTLLVTADAGRAAAPLPIRTSFGKLIGASTEMRRLYPLLERLAASEVPVIVEGETGTGKEVLAEALHEEGCRATGPFVVFDCTTVAPSLVESELFGHERGAFTGATQARKGLFEQAEGGTLFIDEIGDLDLGLQPKLLRALERSEIRRVGGNRTLKVDVRIVAATRRNLDAEVQAGRFRDDLFHRLAVARVELPPLRRRRGDVGVLVRHFLKQIGRSLEVPADVLARWSADPWTGNVRALRNAVARWAALGELALAPSAPAEHVSCAPDFIDAVVAQRLPIALARQRVVEEFEQRYVARVLEDHGGVVAKAALASGIARRHFQRLKARSR